MIVICLIYKYILSLTTFNKPSYTGKRKVCFDRAVSDQRSPSVLLNAVLYHCTVLLHADVNGVQWSTYCMVWFGLIHYSAFSAAKAM